jgi:hypothetical protein
MDLPRRSDLLLRLLAKTEEWLGEYVPYVIIHKEFNDLVNECDRNPESKIRRAGTIRRVFNEFERRRIALPLPPSKPQALSKIV